MISHYSIHNRNYSLPIPILLATITTVSETLPNLLYLIYHRYCHDITALTLFVLTLIGSFSSLSFLFDDKRLDVPDTLSILVDATIRAEESHASYATDALADPLVLVAVLGVHHLLRVDVALEVVRDQVEIAVVADRRYHSTKVVGLSESAALNCIKYFVKVRIDGVRSVGVRMAQVLDVLRKGTEEEYVLLPNLPGNLDLLVVSVRALTVGICHKG